jgi:hypothetical protein
VKLREEIAIAACRQIRPLQFLDRCDERLGYETSAVSAVIPARVRISLAK